MGLGATLAPGLHRRSQATPEDHDMDADRFDSVARSLRMPHTRRGVTHVLGGLALGPLALLGLAGAEAKRKKKKKKKKSPAPTVAPPQQPDPCASCSGDEVCTGGRCVVPACGSGGPCRVFLSSTLHTGNLGGLAGADAICQDLAEAAGLPGTYKAWLSDATSAPISRFVPSTGPYRLVNGATIAANWADLTDGRVAAPINVTETGGASGTNTSAWTATNPDGTLGPHGHCSNWSTDTAGQQEQGSGGITTRSEGGWTSGFAGLCELGYHLYCFQQR